MKTTWRFHSDESPTTVEELQELLLINRGIDDPTVFFAPPSPLEFTPEEVGLDAGQLQRAMARLAQARDQRETVVICGDYDADGVCATAVMWEGLRAFGIVAQPFIPEREKHGYGLSSRSLPDILERRPSLIVTVDNGIVAHEALAELQRQGIDVIVTDHHQPESEADSGAAAYPPALAVVHSTLLCGTTVAWMVAQELSRAAAEQSLDLTAIATVADQMPLLGAHRAFVVHGLAALRKTQRVGLQQLMLAAALETDELSVTSLNYVIVPRINAMGRIKHGLEALRLLCTTNPTRAAQLVDEVNATNALRQQFTMTAIESALTQSADWENENIIILAQPKLHEGIIGLVAGKLMEQFHKPAIVISLDGAVAKASARSVPGVNITELLRQVRDDLIEVGGHPLAAGFSLQPEKVAVVTKRLQDLARAQIVPEKLGQMLELDLVLPPELLTLEAFAAIQQLAPFGQGNWEPRFAISDARLQSVRTIGKNQDHLKLVLEHPALATPLTGLAWQSAHRLGELQPRQALVLAGQLRTNTWREVTSLQLNLLDWHVA